MNTTDLIETPAPRDEAEAPRPGRTTAEIVYDVGTVVALLVGGLVLPVAGWVAGVAMLWNGPRWSIAWRWVGTLAWPVAVALGLVLTIVLPGRVALVVGAPLGVLLLVGAHVGLAVAAARAGARP